MKDKQIEEMAQIIAKNIYGTEQNADFAPNAKNASKELYTKGYRKASEVAEEIEKYILEGASTIQTDNSDALYGAKFAIEKVVLPILEAYKKKYTEDGE